MCETKTKKCKEKHEIFMYGQEHVDERNDPFSFEKYCGVCIFFKTHDCPYLDKVLSDTEWAKIPCGKFYD